MKKSFLIVCLLWAVLACQVIPTPPPLKTPAWRDRTPEVTPTIAGLGNATPEPLASTPPLISATPAIKTTPAAAPGELQPFPTPSEPGFASQKMTAWAPAPYAETNDSLPVTIENLVNRECLAGLTLSQRNFLSENGFVVMRSQEAQFMDIRTRVSASYGQPYFLTSDAAYHALHLAFDELLAALEREELRPRVVAITRAIYQEVISYYPFARGKNLEDDVQMAAAYLGVALRLFDPQASLEPDLATNVEAQIEQIQAGRGIENSRLMPNFQDDYTAYQPVGHYAEDENLKTYFQGMTWFSRVSLPTISPDPQHPSSRAPLIITMALRRVVLDDQPADQEWASIDDALTFLVGSSSDSGPREVAKLMDQVYGRNVTILSLGDESRWDTFQLLTEQLPPPLTNSTLAGSLTNPASGRGWSLFGQRFSLDRDILQNLVYDRVGLPDQPRELPSGLDVMAALGSSVALTTLDEAGATSYENYPAQMTKLQNAVQILEDERWLGTAFGAWLYTFLPQLAAKAEWFPPLMRTTAWAYKDMNSALGSWAELKHDAPPQVMLPEMTGGNEPPSSAPAPGYVEPNPAIFYRLAWLAGTIVDGLNERGMTGSAQDDPQSLHTLINEMQELAERFQLLGEIAVKELSGIPLEQDDFYLIQAPLGLAEKRAWLSLRLHPQDGAEDQTLLPVPVVTAAASAGDRSLQVGVGPVNRIFVVVPLVGGLQVAQGGVYSYYEFIQPSSESLTDQSWQRSLRAATPELPDWADQFSLQGGRPVDVLAFRVGDIYIITAAGAGLKIREAPTHTARTIQELQAGVYVLVVEGPIVADGLTWWKLNPNPYEPGKIEGWAVEDPAWYERAWGQ
ncbi:MAG: DUF3160 domain-containing protein [Anaerolineales bacterium]|nr:DUF3160 domain-containing protein [Anaerolineales bacterium]